jgi:hypothetical protein
VEEKAILSKHGLFRENEANNVEEKTDDVERSLCLWNRESQKSA